MSDRILIIIPTYNEAQNIRQLIDRLTAITSTADVLVVDDGSPDGTAELVERVQEESQRVFLIKRTGKSGRGSAVLAGFAFALQRDYDLIFEMDADFSHKPEEIPSLLQAIESADVVIGSRYLPQSAVYDWGWKRTIFSRWANRYARFVLRIPISDYTNGYRCYRRKAIATLDTSIIDARGYAVLSEIAYQLYRKQFRFAEVPTVFVNRRRGTSNFSLEEIGESFFAVLRIRLRTPIARAL